MVLRKTSVVGLVVGHIAEAIVAAPEQWPDIHILWNLTICWGCFMVYWGWLVWGLWKGDITMIWYRYFSAKRKTQ